MIDQLAEALAALLKTRNGSHWREAQQLLQETGLKIFGMDYGVLVSMDAKSVAHLLGPSRVVALAKLVVDEAKIFEAQGKISEAQERLEYAQMFQEIG